MTGLFADEIMNFLIKSPRLEHDIFRFGKISEHDLRNMWAQFPDRFKRQYINKKIGDHPKRPCMMSRHIHEVAEISDQNLCEGKEGVSMETLIDAWLCGKHRPLRYMIDETTFEECFFWYDAQQRDRLREPWVTWEPPEQTLRIVIVVNAILRGDSEALQRFIDDGADLQEESTRFGLIPLQVASSRGNADITKVLVENNCSMEFRFFFYTTFHATDVLCDAVRNDNIEALEVWIDHIKSTCNSIVRRIRPVIQSAARAGKVDSARLLLRIFESEPIIVDLAYFCLIQGIKTGQAQIVNFVMSKYGGYKGVKHNSRDKGPLLTALQDCPGGSPRGSVLTILLNHGFDPNVRQFPSSRLPLQIAVEKADLDSALILLQYGAIISRTVLPSLLLSSNPGGSNFVTNFLNIHVNEYCLWKGRKCILRKDQSKLAHVEDVFLQLGYREEDMADQSSDFYMDVYG